MRRVWIAVGVAAIFAAYANSQCMDQNPVCPMIFFNTTTNTTNGAACASPAFASLVPYCPLSCNLCGQLGYNCNNTLSQNTCMSLTSQCNSSAPLYTFMQLYCPATCALCPKTGGGICSDTAGVNCSSIASLCNNPSTFTLLTNVCPFTCQRCPTNSSTVATTTTAIATTITTTVASVTTTTATSTTCADIATNCVANVGLCTNAVYATLMGAQCKKTCGFCTGVTSVACVNANTNCAIWVQNGFCTDSAYTTAQIQSYCALSCGLCTG